jgi:hypothetical protein
MYWEPEILQAPSEFVCVTTILKYENTEIRTSVVQYMVIELLRYVHQ